MGDAAGVWDTGLGLKETDGASKRSSRSFKCVGAIVIVAELVVEVPENIRTTCREYGVEELLLVDLAEIEFVVGFADPGEAKSPLLCIALCNASKTSDRFMRRPKGFMRSKISRTACSSSVATR